MLLDSGVDCSCFTLPGPVSFNNSHRLYAEVAAKARPLPTCRRLQFHWVWFRGSRPLHHGKFENVINVLRVVDRCRLTAAGRAILR